MKKRVISAVGAFLGVILLCSCAGGNEADAALKEFLIKTSAELTVSMGSLAGNEGYRWFAGGYGMPEALIRDIGENEYGAPNAAFIVSVPDETMRSLVGRVAGGPIDGDIYGFIASRVYMSIPSATNARVGVNELIATSVLSVSKSYVRTWDDTDTKYVLLFYDSYNSVTLFMNTGDGVVTAASSFIFLPEELYSAGDLLNRALFYMFNDLGILDLEINFTSEYISLK